MPTDLPSPRGSAVDVERTENDRKPCNTRRPCLTNSPEIHVTGESAEQLDVRGRVPFSRALTDDTGGQRKILRRDYLRDGFLPIIDQGQTAVAGYTNDENAAYKGSLPVVLFGDHTRIFKYVDFPFTLGADGVKVLQPSSLYDPKFIYYYLSTRNIPARGYSRHFRSLKQITFPFISLSEQRRIVEILDQADNLRRLRTEADAKADRILPSLFVRMFGDPATNPMQWPVKRISEVCNVVSGATPKTERPEFWGGGIPWATPKDLSELDGWSLDHTARTLTEEGLASCSAAMVPESSVLLSSRAPIGLVAVAGVPMCTNQGFKNLICGPDVDPWYLFGWCRIRTTYLQSLGRGATFREISKRIVESIELPMPPMQRQRRFRSRLMNLTSIHRARIQSAQRIADLFGVLLGRAFSGSLTASWREAHKDEILQELEQKASR